MAEIDPMHQFQIRKVLELPTVAGVDLSITNSVLAMLIAAGAICLFFAVATARAAVVPGRLQSVGESLYLLVNDLAESIIGHEGKKFFPFVFTLFAFIMAMNMFGMFIVMIVLVMPVMRMCMMAVFDTVNDRTTAEEQQGFEEGVCHHVEDRRAERAHTHCRHHEPKLADGTVGQHALDVPLA